MIVIYTCNACGGLDGEHPCQLKTTGSDTPFYCPLAVSNNPLWKIAKNTEQPLQPDFAGEQTVRLEVVNPEIGDTVAVRRNSSPNWAVYKWNEEDAWDLAEGKIASVIVVERRIAEAKEEAK